MSDRRRKSRRSVSRNRPSIRQRVEEPTRRAPDPTYMTLPPEIRSAVVGHLPLADQMQMWQASQATREEMHSKGTFEYDNLVAAPHMRARGVDMAGKDSSVSLLPTWGLSLSKFQTLERVENLWVLTRGPRVLPPHAKKLSMLVHRASDLEGLALSHSVVHLEVTCGAFDGKTDTYHPDRGHIKENNVNNLRGIVEQLGHRLPNVRSLALDISVHLTATTRLRETEVPLLDLEDSIARHFPSVQKMYLQVHSMNRGLVRLVLPNSVHSFIFPMQERLFCELRQIGDRSDLQYVQADCTMALKGDFPALKRVDARMLHVDRVSPSIVSLAVTPDADTPRLAEFVPNVRHLSLNRPQGPLDFLEDFVKLQRLELVCSRHTPYSIGTELPSVTALILYNAFPTDWGENRFPNLDLLAVRAQSPEGMVPSKVTKAFFQFSENEDDDAFERFCELVLDTLQTLCLIDSVPMRMPDFEQLTTLSVFPSHEWLEIPDSVTQFNYAPMYTVLRPSAALRMTELPHKARRKTFHAFVSAESPDIEVPTPLIKMEQQEQPERRFEMDVGGNRVWRDR